MATTLKCIVCRERDINPMIGGIEGPHNKSFCSRICHGVYHNLTLQFSTWETLQRIANTIHLSAQKRVSNNG